MVTPGHRQCHRSTDRIYSLYRHCFFLVPFLRYRELFVDSCKFPSPRVFGALVVGDCSIEILPSVRLAAEN